MSFTIVRTYTRTISGTVVVILMAPGIGLMKRRLENKQEAVSVCISDLVKKYSMEPQDIKILETEYDEDSGDWYVAAEWSDGRVVVRMDSVFATIIDITPV